MAALQSVARPESADPQLLALKVPPHSIEAEQALLGALLIDNQAFDKIGDLVSGEDFYRDDHRRIWRYIVRLVENNQPADVVTVADSIESSVTDPAIEKLTRVDPVFMNQRQPVFACTRRALSARPAAGSSCSTCFRTRWAP